MTKSPPAVARTAPDAARGALPAYSSRYSRHDFTQHQHCALLTPREFLRADYRGPEQMLREWAELRAALGRAQVPDHATMQGAAERLLMERGAMPGWRGGRARRGTAA